MPLPSWPEVRAALTNAISSALPMQIRLVDGAAISGVGLHIDGYYGGAGLYLLPESDSNSRTQAQRHNIGDWPISTDWNCSDDHAMAFAAHWQQWDDWFHDHLDDLTDEEQEEKLRGLLRVACDAMKQVQASGLFHTFPQTADFRIIIAEHDEPDDLSLERYDLFVTMGSIRVRGEAP